VPNYWQIVGAFAAVAAAGVCPAQTDARYGRVELSFEANWGQADPAVKFLARGAGYGVLVTPSETILTVSRRPAASREEGPALRKSRRTGESAYVRMQLAGASRDAEVLGVGLLPGKANYFAGRDPSRWRTEIPTYRQVEVKGVYPGVDLVYYGAGRELEYDFVVAPGADPDAIRLSYEGVEDLRVEANGDLVLTTKLGEIRQQNPVVYQETGGKRQAIAGTHVRLGAREAGFRVREYDRGRPLTIDPRLSYSTLLGGAGAEAAIAMTVDSSGNAYVTGATTSLEYPVASPYQGAANPTAVDAFVTKLNATGTALVYSTYLHGGDDTDQVAEAIAVNGKGEAFIGGSTESSSFPTTPGAYQTTTTDACCSDGFITKLSASGSSLVYSTYVGGADADDISALAVDSFGAVYATGESTTAAIFPARTAAIQAANAGGAGDAFALKLNPAGSEMVYATFLGGSEEDRGTGIAVDSAGAAYVTGWTDSTDYPRNLGLQTPGGGRDVLFTYLNSEGSALGYSTRFGGLGQDAGAAIALDAQNGAYVVGRSASTNIQIYANAPPLANRGGNDVLLAAFDANNVSCAALWGGSGDDAAWGVAVDAARMPYVAGVTASADFPVTSGALQSARTGKEEGFITRRDCSQTGYSSFLGGAGDDEVDAIALDPGGAVYVAGTTASADFPTTQGAFQTALRGASDAFLTKLELDCRNQMYMAVVAGNNQTGTAETALASPLIVELRNGCTGPVAGQRLLFGSGAATLDPATVVTGKDGRASSTATLGPGEGSVVIGVYARDDTGVVFAPEVHLDAVGRAAENVAVTSAASYRRCGPSPGMIAVAWGEGFAARGTVATSLPLPTLLDGVIVSVTDSAGVLRNAGLFAVYPNQINFEIPAETQGGPATVRITAPGGVQMVHITIESVCPALFSRDASGTGAPAGQALRYAADGTFLGASDAAQPIGMGQATDQVILALYGTGFRGATGLANVSVRIGGEVAEPLYAGVQPSFAGLDQLNVRLPRAVAGQGEVPVVLVVDGKAANTVTVQAAQ
jgi:uncharacterized protein (TIGR03437 family)